jgi:hypothetical protein
MFISRLFALWIAISTPRLKHRARSSIYMFVVIVRTYGEHTAHSLPDVLYGYPYIFLDYIDNHINFFFIKLAVIDATGYIDATGGPPAWPLDISRLILSRCSVP